MAGMKATNLILELLVMIEVFDVFYDHHEFERF